MLHGSWGLSWQAVAGVCVKSTRSHRVLLSLLERPQPLAAFLSVFTALRLFLGSRLDLVANRVVWSLCKKEALPVTRCFGGKRLATGGASSTRVKERTSLRKGWEHQAGG